MIQYIEYLNIPITVAATIAAAFLIMQLIGELLELKGKVVPEFLKVRKFFARRKAEKQERVETLREVKGLLADVNKHYATDNIARRDAWIKWVGDRAEDYDRSIIEINNTLTEVTNALNANTKMTEEMFVQQSRDRIIDFATKCSNTDCVVAREEFNRIFKVYTKYETFLKEHGMTNGEIDIAYRLIIESYEDRMKNHTFLEDTRWKTGQET